MRFITNLWQLITTFDRSLLLAFARIALGRLRPLTLNATVSIPILICHENTSLLEVKILERAHRFYPVFHPAHVWRGALAVGTSVALGFPTHFGRGMRRSLVILLGLLLLDFAHADPVRAIVCNARSDIIFLVNETFKISESDPSRLFFIPGKRSLQRGYPPNPEFQNGLRKLLRGPNDSVSDRNGKPVSSVQLLKEIDDPWGVSLQPAGTDCIAMYIGESALDLVPPPQRQ